MKNVINSSPHRQEGWNGYAMEDLRYRRAFVAAKRDLEKERLLHNVTNIHKNATTTVSNVARRAVGSVPVFNYALMAFTVGARVWKLVSSFKRKKKKRR